MTKNIIIALFLASITMQSYSMEQRGSEHEQKTTLGDIQARKKRLKYEYSRLDALFEQALEDRWRARTEAEHAATSSRVEETMLLKNHAREALEEFEKRHGV